MFCLLKLSQQALHETDQPKHAFIHTAQLLSHSGLNKLFPERANRRVVLLDTQS